MRHLEVFWFPDERGLEGLKQAMGEHGRERAYYQ
jgi:hypothetical protein